MANKASVTSLQTTTSNATSNAIPPSENTPLISQVDYDHETVIVHKMSGRPTLPLPLVIAHRLQLYLASECKAVAVHLRHELPKRSQN